MVKPRNPYYQTPRSQVIPNKKKNNTDHLDDYDEGQPTWEQEWQDFGEVYDDEPNYI